MRGQRRLVLAQITHARPHWTENARTRLARRVFVEMGRNAASVARLARRDPGQALGNLRKSGPGRIEDLAGGAVVVSAHLGPWELGPTALARLGVPVWVVVRPVREARLDRLVTRLRTAHGPRLLPRDADARRVRRLLREGAVVVVAADQQPRGRRVAGTFLGRPAWIPTGPALLARAADVPIVPMVVRRSGPGRHELRVGQPIPLDRRMPRPEAVAAAARAASGALERFVEDDLEQWGSWFHERWKEVPRPCPSDPH
jgi:KDO2-lipid IV(A) lauroyltransferase